MISPRFVDIRDAALLSAFSSARAASALRDRRTDRLRALEVAANGRLGAYILDTHTNTGFGWREHERVAHCSSFKMSLAAMVLAKAERGEARLDEVLRWSASRTPPSRCWC